MRIRFARVTGIGKRIGLDEDKGFVAAVVVVIVIIAATVVGYYVLFRPAAEPYSSIYLLDSNNQASAYPDVLVVGHNNTFTVNIGVENHLGNPTDFQVQIKTVQAIPANLPINATVDQAINMGTIGQGSAATQSVTIAENQVGSYSVVFELYKVAADGSLVFTENYCALNIQVIK